MWADVIGVDSTETPAAATPLSNQSIWFDTNVSHSRVRPRRQVNVVFSPRTPPFLWFVLFTSILVNWFLTGI